jgi:hypothetical protein
MGGVRTKALREPLEVGAVTSNTIMHHPVALRFWNSFSVADTEQGASAAAREHV